MANILMVTLVFAPDGVSTSVLMTELALELQALGHNMTVLTTTPHYNEDSEARHKQPLRPRWGKLLYESDCHGIPVFHARVQTKSNRILSRLFDYVRFHLVSTLAGIMLIKNYDLIFAPSPPLTIGLSAWVLGLVRRVPFLYNVQEIYPDVAVSLGVLKHRGVIWLLEQLERFIYARSRKVLVISDWFRRCLLAKGVPDEKMVMIPNFVDTEFMQPGERHNQFSKTHELDEKFVVLYAGNIGLTQHFENVLAAAKRLSHLPDLCLLIVGDGARRAWLETQLQQAPLSNVRLLPYQPRSAIPEMYASSDMCLVPLKRGTAQHTFPSKIYTIMAAGRPVIVASDEDSELAWVVKESGAGWAVPPDDEIALAHAIEEAYQRRSELPRMGQIARQYIEQYYSKQVVAQQYDRLINEITSHSIP